jgi:hypothetical protein
MEIRPNFGIHVFPRLLLHLSIHRHNIFVRLSRRGRNTEQSDFVRTRGWLKYGRVDFLVEMRTSSCVSTCPSNCHYLNPIYSRKVLLSISKKRKFIRTVSFHHEGMTEKESGEREKNQDDQSNDRSPGGCTMPLIWYVSLRTFGAPPVTAVKTSPFLVPTENSTFPHTGHPSYRKRSSNSTQFKFEKNTKILP